MKIAVIGSGVSGLVVAYRLQDRHQVTVFEAADRVGGHVHTVSVPGAAGQVEVDTGFIVYNRRNYPRFCALLDELGVETQPSQMTFSVRCERSGLEYMSAGLNTLFAQRRNLLRPSFYGMLRDILRFNRQARAALEPAYPDSTLQEFLDGHGFGPAFVRHYLIPMGAAIWSAPPRRFTAFPLKSFVRFLHNHGLLSVSGQPRWRVVCGGSRRYVERLTRDFAEPVRTGCPVQAIQRRATGVRVITDAGEELFDQVVVACHSDQALALLQDPSATERSVLGALRYQINDAVLHTDTSLLPRRRRAWAAWNYHLPRNSQERVAVTYNMNILQSLPGEETYCVTLNHDGQIDPDRVIRRISYAHPVYDLQGDRARARRAEINGVNRTWYCGAYWGFGFHEDGARSGEEVAQALLERPALAA